jgi:PAS domain S-box-containing protein
MDKLYNYFLFRYINKDFIRLSQARLILQFCLVTALFSLLYVIVALTIDFIQSMVVMTIMAWLFTMLAFMLRAGVSHRTISHFYLVFSYLAAVVLIYFSGLMYSSLVPWLAFLPLSANLLINRNASLAWLSATFITVFVLMFITKTETNIAVEYNKRYEVIFYAFVYNGLSAIILVLSMVFQSEKEKYLDLLKEKSEIISTINQELKNKNDEIVGQNEELIQQQEEIIVQREFIEIKNHELLTVQDELNDIIDKLTRTQQTLTTREAENRRIFNTMYDSHIMVAEMDTEGRILKISREKQQLFQMDAAEIIGKRYDELQTVKLVEFHDVEDDSDFWKDILSGKRSSCEVSIMVNNVVYHLKENYCAIFDESGKPRKVLVMSQDISQLKRQNQEIEELNGQMKDKLMEIEKQNSLLVKQREEIATINDELKKSNKEISDINSNLEKHVHDRTHNLELQNKVLAEYAYINAHLLRGPLCSILGLVNIMETELNSESHPVILHMKKSTDELHEVVKRITKAIEKGSHFDRSLLHGN